MLDYFPDDFDQDLTYIRKGELYEGRKQEEVKKWDADFLELMEYTRNLKYGKLKCFHCVLSPDGAITYLLGLIDWLPKD